MEAVSLTPAYIPLYQKPNCCAVACLQMIIYRNGFGLHDQEDLAIEFGVRIPPEHKEAFRENMPIMTGFNFDEGISTIGSIDRINAFFDRSGVALSASALPFSEISDLKGLLIQNLSQNNDIWIECHSNETHASDMNNNRIHDLVVESFDQKTGLVTLIDPSPRRRQRMLVPVEILERSMSDIFGQELGLLLIEKKTA